MSKDILKILKSYNLLLNDEDIKKQTEDIIASNYDSLYTVENLKKNFSFIELTTLNSTDTRERIKRFAKKVNNFHNTFDIPNVATIVVYPNMVPVLKENLKTEGVNITSVAGAFPSSQSFIEVKLKECELVAKSGADEIDIVLPMASFLEKDYQRVFDDIVAQKNACGDKKVKVILETGELTTATNIRTASVIAMEAGADFIKTSTGKVSVNATLEAAHIMTKAIREYHERAGKVVGFKPSGGINTAKDVIEFYAICHNNLKTEWLNSRYMRIGASGLANSLLSEIHKIETGKEEMIEYF
ncbi:MAG: deoxyribose-phosphate aldolase [Bacteroidales bacterium]|jgi:deoxyribose-phosphate aldolase|nr:deoxyribose-phosphate aldolase [Bacteroidales bacterium]